MEAARLLDELYGIATGNGAEERLADWSERAVGVRPVIVVLPRLAVHREQFRREIIRFQVEAINKLATKIRADLSRIDPMRMETPAEREWRTSVAIRHAEVVERLRREAVAEAQQHLDFTPVSQPAASQPREIYTPGLARRQLDYVVLHGFTGM